MRYLGIWPLMALLLMQKTSFLLLNANSEQKDECVRIGAEVVKRESSAKLLGIQFQGDMTWKEQIYGKEESFQH